MPVYLARHADAVYSNPDARRPLSDYGRSQVRALAEFFCNKPEFSPAEFWFSPLLRARQTAELFAQGLGSDAKLLETDGLRPEDDPQEIAFRLADLDPERGVVVVGHEPHLGSLAMLLIHGDAQAGDFSFHKGAVLALKRSSEPESDQRLRWAVRWYVTPEMILDKKS